MGELCPSLLKFIHTRMQMAQMEQKDFFAEATESQRYKITEVIGKGSYGIVASAVDQFTGKSSGCGLSSPDLLLCNVCTIYSLPLVMQARRWPLRRSQMCSITCRMPPAFCERLSYSAC